MSSLGLLKGRTERSAGPRWLLVGLVALVLVLAACISDPVGTEARLEALGATTCPDTVHDYRCVTLTVPIDPDHPEGDTIEVQFAVQPATGQREGVLVTVVGGPGGSGLEAKEWQAFSETITTRFDLVFFDQRGIGMFTESCPQADESFSDESYDGWWLDFDSTTDFYAEYMPACSSELPHQNLLPFLGTTHAIDDLEAFREAMDYEKLTIYGQSYGTAYAQHYATRYPDRVERLVLDGTIDLTRTSLDLARDRAEAMEEILARMFEQCDAEPNCSIDMGVPSRVAYDSLLRRLGDDGIEVSFPFQPDKFEPFLLTADSVAEFAFDAAYLDTYRMLFLRALATAFSDSDLVPMVRLLALDAGATVDSTLSWAVGCLDLVIPGTVPNDEAAAISDLHSGLPDTLQWLTHSATGCSYWPHYQPTHETADPFTADGIPVMLVATFDDPTTPYSHTEAVYQSLADGYLMSVDGGSHVMYGRGVDCIDRRVNAFLRGLSTGREATCEVPAAYYPPKLSTVGSREWVLYTLEEEFYYMPEFQTWDGFETLSVGCTHGGEVIYFGDEDGVVHFEAVGCGIGSQGIQVWEVDGFGSWHFDEGFSLMSIESGDRCRETYEFTWGEDEAEVSEFCT